MSFIELPGELRNRIYEYILLDYESYGFPLFRNLKSSLAFTARHPGQRYLGLTQVNKLIRSEFHPLYSGRQIPEIRLPDLPQYLTTFPLKDGALSRQFVSTLSSITSLSNLPRPQPGAPGIDILPLLQFDWCSVPFDVSFVARPWSQHICDPVQFLYWFVFHESIRTLVQKILRNNQIDSVHIGRKVEAFGRDSIAVTISYGPEINAEVDLNKKIKGVWQFFEATEATPTPRIFVQCDSGGWKLYCRSGAFRVRLKKLKTGR